MALSLFQYAEQLEARPEPRPLGPEPQPFASARAHTPRLPVRAVVWSGYGDLLLARGGEPQLLPADAIMRKIALEKTIREFRMWASMTRKPGDPADVMATTIEQVSTRMTAERITGGRTELRFDKIWLGVLNRLCQKDYVYDAGLLGDMPQLAEKVTFFYLRAAYGVSAFGGALKTLKAIRDAGLTQGIHANGQINSPVQLAIELRNQGSLTGLGDVFDPSLCLWSFETGVRKESERGMALLEQALAAKGIKPAETLIVGSDAARDVAPARKRGFQTALLLADRQTAVAKPADLKDERTRPHALLVAIEQAIATLPN
ncbi:MAG TPA: hypothetical protein VNC50_03125 [Planctomycetia bacterium]|jgi:FMN phosphatase YigB (HAD superfamily)|nr:hypothetical protein [Planctomycetia bacterium]